MSSESEIKQENNPCKKNENHKQNWMESLFVCIKPVLQLIGRTEFDDLRMRGDDWEIPFEMISGTRNDLINRRFNRIFCIEDLEWLGSGAQGAVFSGKIGTEIVAVKKVKDVRETEIRHLKKLNHENIVKFK